MRRPCDYCGKKFNRIKSEGVKYSCSKLCVTCYYKSREGNKLQRQEWLKKAKAGKFLNKT